MDCGGVISNPETYDWKYHGLNDIDDYYSKPNYYSYFVKVDGKFAGLAVLRFEKILII